MVNVKVGLYDRYVLKPLWVLYIILILRYFIGGAWLIGSILVLIWFLISVIGQALHPNMTTLEMARSTTPSDDEINNDPNPDELSDIETVLINKANLRVAGLIGITAIVISWHYSVKWYFTTLIGCGAWLLSMIIVPIYSLYLIGHKLKQKKE
jgi:hypothetical protein